MKLLLVLECVKLVMFIFLNYIIKRVINDIIEI